MRFATILLLGPVLAGLTSCRRPSTSPQTSAPCNRTEPPPVVVTVPEVDCLEGQPSAPIPAEQLRLLVENMRARCTSADGSMRSISAPCLTVGEAFDLAEAMGNLITWAVAAETLCRASTADMGGIR